MDLKEAFEKAKEWNRLTMLEVENLRSIVADQGEPVDAIDMMRDEFMRIAACPGATEEIKGLCERAVLGISQKVPVLEQRDQLSAENERLRKALEHYIDMTTLAIPDWWDWQGNCGRGPDANELEKRDVGDVAREALGINDVVNERL